MFSTRFMNRAALALALVLLHVLGMHSLALAEPASPDTARAELGQATRLLERGGNWQTANHLLLRLLANPETSDEITSSALALLERHGDETCVVPLMKLLERPGAIRQRATEALVHIPGRNVARAIQAGFGSLPADRQPELSSTLSRRPDLGQLQPASPAEAVSSGPGSLKFERRKLSDQRFEAATVADIDQDGTPDIVSGGFWYPGPDFTSATRICDVVESNEYYDDFSDFPMDVNGDSFPDIITGGFFGGPLRWRENPRGQATEWKEHRIVHIGPIETTRFWDVDGDGFPEVCPNAAGNIIVFRLKRTSDGRGTGEFTSHTVRRGGVGHGLGFGDINGDGRGDFIGPDGWYESPENPLGGAKWNFHPEFTLGSASVPILVYDVNRDGRNDLIVGQGHDYGLHWYEQVGGSAPAAREWKKHTIEPDRSQFHELYFADLDKDGTPELLTGKRWRAHNDNDPGAHDPLGLYYYQIRDGRFHRTTLDYGPGNASAGTGIYMWVADVDGNGWPDIVAPGKQGLYLLRNHGQNP